MVDQLEPNDVAFRQPGHFEASEASVKLDAFLGQAITDLTPQGKPAVTASSPTGFVPGEISNLFKTLRARKDAMVADIMTNGAEVAATLAAGEAMSAQLKAEGDAMKAEFGLLTNGPPA